MRTLRHVLILSVLVTGGCSANTPTAPPPQEVQAPVTTGVPPASPVPPELPPVSPTPTPSPTPPSPAGVEYFDAVAEFIAWRGAPLFDGDRCIVEVWTGRDEVWLHSTRLKLIHDSGEPNRQVTGSDMGIGVLYLEIWQERFRLTGPKGDVVGKLTPRKP